MRASVTAYITRASVTSYIMRASVTAYITRVSIIGYLMHTFTSKLTWGKIFFLILKPKKTR